MAIGEHAKALQRRQSSHALLLSRLFTCPRNDACRFRRIAVALRVLLVFAQIDCACRIASTHGDIPLFDATDLVYPCHSTDQSMIPDVFIIHASLVRVARGSLGVCVTESAALAVDWADTCKT